MSLKARRVSGGVVPLERFEWNPGASGSPLPASSSPRPWQPPDVSAALPVAPDEPARPAASEPLAPTPDQQAQLAALERDAFTKGYAQGERAGLEAGAKRAEAMLRRLAQTLEELASLRDTMVRQTERELVQLSLAIARRILQREASVDPELASALAHIALERLGTTSPATVRLHPADYASVTSDTLAAGTRQVEIVADPSVARGGCVVESEFGFIDASIDSQMDEIARAVLGDAPSPVPARRGVA